MGIFELIFTQLLYVPFYTRLQIFIQLGYLQIWRSTKLYHTKRSHPTNFLHFTRSL